MLATQITHSREDQQEARAGVKRTHPRYAYDHTWQHDISRCEQGRPPILGASCRCGGTLFGQKRGDGFAYFAQLPTTDPHSFQVTWPRRQ
jgi:hypothetical protein